MHGEKRWIESNSICALSRETRMNPINIESQTIPQFDCHYTTNLEKKMKRSHHNPQTGHNTEPFLVSLYINIQKRDFKSLKRI